MNQIIDALKKHKGDCNEVDKSIYLSIYHNKKESIVTSLNWCYQNKALFISYINSFVQEFDFIKKLSKELNEIVEEKASDLLREWEKDNDIQAILEYDGSYSFDDDHVQQANSQIKDDALDDVKKFNYNYELFGEDDNYEANIKHLTKLLTYLY